MVQNLEEGTLDCSCNSFVRDGILYRHALKVLLNDEAEKYLNGTFYVGGVVD